MRRRLVTLVGMFAAVPVARATGMGGGMMGGGDGHGAFGNGMGGQRNGWLQSLLCPADDRGPDGRGRVDREPDRDPYATLDLSDEQRLEIDQIRLTMHREERRRIDAVLSAQQREQLDHERTGR